MIPRTDDRFVISKQEYESLIESSNAKDARIVELEGEGDMREDIGYKGAIDDVLALPQEGAWEKPETGMALEVTPMWGVKVIRVSDIEALRGEG